MKKRKKREGEIGNFTKQCIGRPIPYFEPFIYILESKKRASSLGPASISAVSHTIKVIL